MIAIERGRILFSLVAIIMWLFPVWPAWYVLALYIGISQFPVVP